MSGPDTVIRLVRHGRAAAGWDVDVDPDLDDLGRQQAAVVAPGLAAIPGLSIVSSPLRRCRSTAQACAEIADIEVQVEPLVAEIPSPDGVAMGDRVVWLREAMQGTWAQLGSRYVAYRDGVVDTVRSYPDGTVVFSHFVAINAVIGACAQDDRVVIASLDNCSVTTVGVIDGELVLLESGREADTLIR